MLQNNSKFWVSQWPTPVPLQLVELVLASGISVKSDGFQGEFNNLGFPMGHGIRKHFLNIFHAWDFPWVMSWHSKSCLEMFMPGDETFKYSNAPNARITMQTFTAKKKSESPLSLRSTKTFPRSKVGFLQHFESRLPKRSDDWNDIYYFTWILEMDSHNSKMTKWISDHGRRILHPFTTFWH